jgi:hypothetical protein
VLGRLGHWRTRKTVECACACAFACVSAAIFFLGLVWLRCWDHRDPRLVIDTNYLQYTQTSPIFFGSLFCGPAYFSRHIEKKTQRTTCEEIYLPQHKPRERIFHILQYPDPLVHCCVHLSLFFSLSLSLSSLSLVSLPPSTPTSLCLLVHLPTYTLTLPSPPLSLLLLIMTAT